MAVARCPSRAISLRRTLSRARCGRLRDSLMMPLLVALAGACCAGMTTTGCGLGASAQLDVSAADEFASAEFGGGRLDVVNAADNLDAERWFPDLHHGYRTIRGRRTDALPLIVRGGALRTRESY